MAPISSAGNVLIPAAQPTNRQAERPAPASEELVIKKEQQLQRVDDTQGRGTSEQSNSVRDNQSSPSVTQSDNAKSEEKREIEQQSSGERQKIEAAQQETERAEFNQQAGVSREEQSNDVRPSSNEQEAKRAPVVLQEKENPAIKIFDSLQNINASSRQGQSLNQFV